MLLKLTSSADTVGIINILNSNGSSIGTGFFVSSDGYILTCYHVLKQIGEVKIGSLIGFRLPLSKTVYSATVGAYNSENDIALLRSNNYSKIYYPLATNVEKGEKLSTMGFPNGSYIGILAEPVFFGFIGQDKKIQLDDANTITHGFSGAPLIDGDGHTIGMVAWIPHDSNYRMENLAFGIFSETILSCFSAYLQTPSHDSKFSGECKDNSTEGLFASGGISKDSADFFRDIMSILPPSKHASIEVNFNNVSGDQVSGGSKKISFGTSNDIGEINIG